MRLVLLLVAVAGAGALHVDLPAPYNDYCLLENNTNVYKQEQQFNIPWFNIDLRDPPEKRWVHIAQRYKEEIKELIGVLIDFITPLVPGAREFVDKEFADVVDKFPTPYRQEIESIAAAAGMPVGEIVVYNIFYEIFTVCTSIIAQDPQGNVFHARNLDFGLFLGWNGTSHNWEISSHLRKMIINVNWIGMDGKILYKSNNFAGYIGIYNGLKPQKFSLTANERFMAEGGYIGIIRWLLDMEPNGKWMSWLARETLEQADSYQAAKTKLSTDAMLSPVYYILGGMNKWEGCIITRSLNDTDLVNELDPNTPDGWFLLQTNYDQNLDPLFLDDRRTPGNKCMKTLGQKNVGFQGLYNVLSSRTNLNKLTTYTVLIHVASGRFETHQQSCDGPCWPF